MEEITSKYGIPTTIEEAIEGIDKFETDLKTERLIGLPQRSSTNSYMRSSHG